MFKRKMKLYVLFSAILVVSAFMLISNVITGQASSVSGNEARGVGVVNIDSLEISIDEYNLMEDDPTRIKSIRIEVNDDRVTGDVNIIVSADGGDNWASCRNSEASIWICTYSDSEAPLVIEMQAVEVVVNG